MLLMLFSCSFEKNLCSLSLFNTIFYEFFVFLGCCTVLAGSWQCFGTAYLSQNFGNSQSCCVTSQRVKNSFTPWQKSEDYIVRLISSGCNLICTSGEIHEYTHFLSEIMCLDVTLYLFFLKISEI